MGAENVTHMALRAASRPKKQSSVISQNAFAGQAQQPTQKAVEEALGQSYALWKKIISDLKNELKLDGEEWNSSGHKYGWSLRLQLKKRNIVYLAPRTGSFMASFALGDKAVAVARKSELPGVRTRNDRGSEALCRGDGSADRSQEAGACGIRQDSCENQGGELKTLFQPQLLR